MKTDQEKNQEQVTETTVENAQATEMTELETLKAELAKAKDDAQRNAERWVKALQDITNYQAAVTAMIKELGWDDGTAIGKIGGYLGQNVFDVIEVNSSSKFQR